jgi:hypothetical protein
MDTTSKLMDGVAFLFDEDIDANDYSRCVKKIMPGSRGISIPLNQDKMAVMNTGIPDIVKKYPISLTSFTNGTYSFNVLLEKNTDDSILVYLVDRYLGIQHSLQNGINQEIPFVLSPDEGSRNPERFELMMSRPMVVLPVKKINLFASRKNGKCNRISWNLEGIDQTKRITLEKSMNGLQFDSLHNVDISNVTHSMGEYMDHDVRYGDHFYRLSILGVDGRLEYSEVKKVMNDNSEMEVIVYSNGSLNKELKFRVLNAKAGPVELNIVDINGKKIIHEKVYFFDGNQEYVLKVHKKITDGAYFLNIFTGGDVLVVPLKFSE